MSKYCAALAVLLLIGFAGCVSSTPVGSDEGPTTLTVGFGHPTDQSTATGLSDTVRSISLERLIVFSLNDGRPQARLAERWEISPDGLQLKLWLRSDAVFHNGARVTAAAVREGLIKGLPASLGPSFSDVREIRVAGDHQVELLLHRRSQFVFEGLEIPVQQSGEEAIGTGPFRVVSNRDQIIEMEANDRYYGGRPAIDRIVFRSYDSVRHAWAELLRGQVDMVYEVGVDALDLMQPSTQTRVFTVRRPYQYLVILNVKRPALREKAIRRALNAAIDRRALVEQILDGHGTPADGPVWPSHWAYSADLPVFRYQPTRIDHGNKRIRFTCIVPDASTERVALYLQRQLEAVGVDLELQSMPLTEARKRVAVGDFDFFLVDAVHGPTMFRPYWFWYSNGFQNFGNFNSKEVDDAFDHIKNAADDAAYRLGVAALQKAVIEDPPAIFLAWTERARAVSSRFEVPAEPGTDIISSLRLWRPARAPLAASRN